MYSVPGVSPFSLFLDFSDIDGLSAPAVTAGICPADRSGGGEGGHETVRIFADIE
jgi:hypothetical protein